MEDADDQVARRISRARPEVDAIARSVIRARAVKALFGTLETVRVGRYDIVRVIGMGGGGSVFVARDPELDREVAIKLIVTVTQTLRERALAEGKALAKLAHPNVVAVFDVGESDDRVYLVMELVRGASLREHARTSSQRAVLHACRQAAEGLAAAHAEGLVHRDFKPDNVVIGSDGRSRVIDFGLATTGGEAANAAGTPMYMAPEQVRGEPITPASDQYAFGVTLQEAITAAGGVPRWLQPVVTRATARDPQARYPTMAELLRALANDPPTRWRRRATIAVPLALVAMGGVGFALGRDNAGPACAADELLPQDRGAAIERRITAFATPFAAIEATRVRALLASYAQQWGTRYEAACERASDPLHAQRIACLARARSRFDASLELLEGIDAPRLPNATRSLAELPALAACDDLLALSSKLEQPQDAAAVAGLTQVLERARVGVEAATPLAAARVRAITAQARSLGHKPLLADALLVQGRIALALDDRSGAIPPLVEAIRLATAAGADEITVEAFARAMWLRAMDETQQPEARAGFEIVEGVADRLGDRGRFARALLYNNLGVVEQGAGRLDQARAALRTALALGHQVSGPGEVELANVRVNLARITRDPDEQTKLLASAVQITSSRLGRDHPITLDMEIYAAVYADDPARALAATRSAVERYLALHPSFVATIADASAELAWLELSHGTRVRARAAFARANDAAPFVTLLDGDAAAALRAFEAKRTIPPREAKWWELLQAAEIEIGIALASHSAVARMRAIDYLERCIALEPPFTPARRRLAWLQGMSVTSSP